MTNTNVSHALHAELKSRLTRAAKAANMLRDAAERIDSPNPAETAAEQAARVRGASILAAGAAHELSEVAGFVDCVVSVEINVEVSQ